MEDKFIKEKFNFALDIQKNIVFEENEINFTKTANELYKIGYRREKEVAKEILDEVSKHYGGAWLIDLYKKYGVGID